MDYCNIKKKSVIKPHPLPAIGEKIKKLEGFQYASALDLNMRYYSIKISPAIHDMTRNVTEFGKLR